MSQKNLCKLLFVHNKLLLGHTVSVWAHRQTHRRIMLSGVMHWLCVCVFVCVCVRERESERICVCACVSMCVFVCVSIWKLAMVALVSGVHY